MNRFSNISAVLVVALGLVSPAGAQTPIARVGDVTRLQGHGTNVLVGYGLVTGLSGTGDGAKFVPTMRALAATLQRFGANIETMEDVQTARNNAIVMIEVVIPEHGAREGDMLDVQITALAAKSLEGGRLLSTPLIYHDRSVDGLFGFAQGRLTMEGLLLTSAQVKGGARIERDVFINVVSTGSGLTLAGLSNPWIRDEHTYVTLVIDEAHAGWSMAAAVASALDKELSLSAGVDRVALALDSRNVVVLLPDYQRGDPASWIRDIERTAILMESEEARVTINRAAGTIVITGDTTLSPVVVSQHGMTINIANGQSDAGGGGGRGRGLEPDFVALDIERERQANVKDLLEALNRLKVPFKDRVSIIEQIHRAGKLHARIIFEG